MESDFTNGRFVDRRGRLFGVGSKVDLFFAPTCEFSGSVIVVGVEEADGVITLLVGSPYPLLADEVEVVT